MSKKERDVLLSNCSKIQKKKNMLSFKDVVAYLFLLHLI